MSSKNVTLDGKNSRGESALELAKKIAKQNPKPAKASGKSDKKKGK